MLVRLLVIAASALAGALGTLFLRDKVFVNDPGTPPLPEYSPYRPRSRRAPRIHTDASSGDGANVEE